MMLSALADNECKNIEQIRDIPISEVVWPVRVHRRLVELGCVTVRDIEKLSRAQFFTYNFGRKSIRCIEDELNSVGLRLAKYSGEQGEWIVPPITQEMLDAGIRVFYGYGLSDGDLTPGFRPAGAAGAVAEIYRVMRKHEISALMKEKAA